MEPHGYLTVPWSDIETVLGIAWPFVLCALLALVSWVFLRARGRTDR